MVEQPKRLPLLQQQQLQRQLVNHLEVVNQQRPRTATKRRPQSTSPFQQLQLKQRVHQHRVLNAKNPSLSAVSRHRPMKLKIRKLRRRRRPKANNSKVQPKARRAENEPRRNQRQHQRKSRVAEHQSRRATMSTRPSPLQVPTSLKQHRRRKLEQVLPRKHLNHPVKNTLEN